ncbi:MAG: ABC transporter ATP-binding protein [Hyphomicrobiales bacterium]
MNLIFERLDNTVLKIQNLNKRFGRIHAVNNLCLEVEKGSVYGILGPNGSGKTTTLGILLGVINSDSGDFYWFGEKNDNKIRRRIGAIIETPLFYPYMSGENNLKIIADIKGIPYSEISKVLDLVELSSRKSYPFRTYSLGMKQRLAIAGAMLGNPEVLILDEPTNGLDPQGIADIRELILKIASQGITILIASHLLDEIQKICSHVAILQYGKLLSSGNVNTILNDATYIELSVTKDIGLGDVLSGMPEITSVSKVDDVVYRVTTIDGYSSADLNKSLFDKGIVLSQLNIYKKSLESYFLEQLK